MSNAIAETTPSPHYRAFISYRHMPFDETIARKLHKRLESFRPPRPYHRQRVRPVFLDSFELPTTANLSRQIQTALDNSQFLIIICTRHYRFSLYCMAELEYFVRTKGSAQNVLVVLAEGEPSEVFPDCLLTPSPDGNVFNRVEPLGADIRAQNVAMSLKRLKTECFRIIAPILGCGYDNLFRRQTRRRRRRAALIAASAMAVGALTLTYTRYMEHMTRLEQQERLSQETTVVLRGVDTSLQEGDVQTALLLSCEYAQREELTSYEAVRTALTSAVAQYALGECTAFPRVLSASYPYDASDINQGVFYYVPHIDAVLFANVANGERTLLIDARTGAVLRDFGHAQLNITGDAHYLTLIEAIQATPSSVAEQRYTLWDLYKNEMITSRVLKQTELTDLLESRYVTQNGPFAIYEGGVFVCAYDTDGNDVSQQDYAAAMSAIPVTPENQIVPYQMVRQRKGVRVSDANGEMLFELPDDVQHSAFSSDWSRFLYISGERLYSMNTSTWKSDGEMTFSQTDTLLGAGYVNADTRLVYLLLRPKDALPNNSVNVVDVYDLATGKRLLRCEGTPPARQSGERFYVCSEGKLTAYIFRPEYLDDCSAWHALDATGGKALVDIGHNTKLIDTQTGETLMNWDEDTLMAADENLAAILHINDASRLQLTDTNGQALWTIDTEGEVLCLTLSYDGAYTAYATSEAAYMLSRDGTELFRHRLSQPVTNMAAADGRLCIFDGKSAKAVNAEGMQLLDASLLGGECRLYGDLLTLHDFSRNVQNFTVINLRTGATVFRSAENVYSYCYAPATGYLAIQSAAERRNNPYPQISMYRLSENGTLESVYALELDNQFDSFGFDETGETLWTCGDRAACLYTTRDGKRTMCAYGVQGVYRAGRLYSVLATSGGVFSQAMDMEALIDFANRRLTSENGRRIMMPTESLFK